jgi:hypothetical protein
VRKAVNRSRKMCSTDPTRGWSCAARRRDRGDPSVRDESSIWPFQRAEARPLSGSGKAAERTDDPAVSRTELPISLTTALAVVKAAAAGHISLINHLAEASDESGYATADDVFADLPHRPRCPAGTAARIPGAVPGSGRLVRSVRSSRARSAVLPSAASHESEDHCHRGDPRQGSASCFAHGETVVLTRNLLPHLNGCAMLDDHRLPVYGLKSFRFRCGFRPRKPDGSRGASKGRQRGRELG